MTGSMAVIRESPEAALLNDGRVIAIGGKCGYWTGCGYYGTPTVKIYNPKHCCPKQDRVVMSAVEIVGFGS